MFNFLMSSDVIVFIATSLIQGAAFSCLDFSAFLTDLPKTATAAFLGILNTASGPLKTETIVSLPANDLYRVPVAFQVAYIGGLMESGPACFLFLQSLRAPSSHRVLSPLLLVLNRDSSVGWSGSLPLIPGPRR